MTGLLHDEAGYYWRTSEEDSAAVVVAIHSSDERFETPELAIDWLEQHSDMDVTGYRATGDAIRNMTDADRQRIRDKISRLDIEDAP